MSDSLRSTSTYLRWRRSAVAGSALFALSLLVPGFEYGQDKHPMLEAHPAVGKSFLVVIDPAHGGADLGSRFSATANEKDLTLAFARRLRAELQARKISVLLLRDADVHLTAAQRASIANTAQAAVFVSIHAGLPSGGVRLFTALLPSQESAHMDALFLPWESAQAPFLERSRDLAAKLTAEFHKDLIATSLQSAPLAPLNSIVAPAIALELPPTNSPQHKSDRNPEELIKPEFQKSVARAIVAVLAAQRPAPEGTP